MKKIYIDSPYEKAKLKWLAKGKVIIKRIASVGLTLSIFSGGQKLLHQIDKDLLPNVTIANAIEIDDEYVEPNDENIIAFPTSNDAERFITFLDKDREKFIAPLSLKYKDIKNIEHLQIQIVDGVDYSCLNYFPNLKSIKVVSHGINQHLLGFDGSYLKSGIKVSYYNDDLKVLDENVFKFLETIPNISMLNFHCRYYLDGEEVEAKINWHSISNLKNIKGLVMDVDNINGFNIKDFAHLDELAIEGFPLEVARKFNYDDIEECMKLDIKFSSSDMDTLMEILTEPKDEEEIKLNNNIYLSFDDSCDYSQYVQYSTIKYGDAKKVKSLLVNIYDGCDYSCLNNFPNVENLVINDYGYKHYNVYNVYGMKFKKDIKISYYMRGHYNFDNNFLTMARIAFFKDIPSINTLIIDTDTNWDVQFIDWSCIEELKNVKNLSIYLDNFANFKFEDYSHLDTLELRGEPYTVGMYVSTEDIRKLKDSGVEVKYEQINKLNEIEQNLDKIYLSLNIDDQMDDLDKINKIVQYVLKNLEYDPEMSKMLDEGMDASEYAHSFYQNGMLYAALNNETQICGNYSALTNALLKRANINSFNIHSYNHAWTLVELDDYYYSLDTTKLDNYEYYMDSGLYLADPRISHPSAVYPDFFHMDQIPNAKKDEINSIIVEKMSEDEYINKKDNDIQLNIKHQKYKITIKDENYIVDAIELVGLLSGLGIGYFISKKKMKIKDNENEHRK